MKYSFVANVQIEEESFEQAEDKLCEILDSHEELRDWSFEVNGKGCEHE